MKQCYGNWSVVVLFSLCTLLFISDTALADPSTGSKALAEKLGSLRNARVAIKMGDTKTQLTYFTSSISESERAQLAKVAPNVRIVTGLSKKEALARAEEAHGINARYASPEFLTKATKLRWVQVSSAGVDRYLGIKPLMENDKLVLSNNRAVHGPAIADHAMAMLLSLTRNLNYYAKKQKQATWARSGDSG